MLSYHTKCGALHGGQRDPGLTIDCFARQPMDDDVEKAADRQAHKGHDRQLHDSWRSSRGPSSRHREQAGSWLQPRSGRSPDRCRMGSPAGSTGTPRQGTGADQRRPGIGRASDLAGRDFTTADSRRSDRVRRAAARPRSARFRSQLSSDSRICRHKYRAAVRSLVSVSIAAATGSSQFGAPGSAAALPEPLRRPRRDRWSAQ